MTYRYEVYQSKFSPSAQNVYGIQGKELQGDEWILIAIASPFAASERAAAQLAAYCTRVQLPPDKLFDAVADFQERQAI